MRMKKCFLLRLCLFVSLLCVCAHVYLEFKDFWLKIWRQATAGTLKHRTHHKSHGQPTSACCPSDKHLRKIHRWKIKLESWAAARHSLEEEANRFIKYISTPKVSCDRRMFDTDDDDGSWVLCLDHRYSLHQRIISKHCRVYSLRLGSDDDGLERALARSGCEVHCFDPSIRGAHLHQSNMWIHKLSVDWRDPNPAVPAQKQHSNTKKLATILNDFSHKQVDVLKLDMESAEWKILENLILEDVLDSVGLLLVEVHVHWAGFEVGGDEPSVIRYWFSVLRELERAHFLLYHSYSDPTKPRVFLHRNFQNTSSSFILGWVNTRFTPQ